MRRTIFGALVLILLGVSVTVRTEARSKKPQKGAFSYYMLVLSYAPDFCNQSGVDKDPRECGAGKGIGFVVHGLWPQGATTRGPENCGSPGTIPADIIQTMLNYFPTESLIQHEWKTHGTCSGLPVAAYFAAVKKVRDSVTIPASLTSSSPQTLAPGNIESKVAAANPGIPATAIRTSCYPDKELQEIRVCFSKGLSPQACGSSAGRCSLPSVNLLPVH
jgi:ribonuclease T2